MQVTGGGGGGSVCLHEEFACISEFTCVCVCAPGSEFSHVNKFAIRSEFAWVTEFACVSERICLS